MEDFVTPEFAQKLKEKEYPLSRVIKQNGNLVIYDLPKNHPNWQDCKAYYIPTIFQVLKWLREEKDIFIGLEYINPNEYGCCIIEQKDGGVIAKWNWSEFRYASKNPLVGNTHENTALAGIEYVRDNLI